MKKIIYFIVLTAIVQILSACSGSTIYDDYAHTPIAGWEKNDTLSFEIPPMLIVEQTVYHKNKKIPGECKKDTVNCQLIDKNGVSKGQGISYYQYNFPINIYQMHQGDSIHVAIRHDMKREILPGVSDIGIKISKIQ